MKKNKTDYIIFENYIYPNDEELGFHIRKLLTEKINNNFPGIQNL